LTWDEINDFIPTIRRALARSPTSSAIHERENTMKTPIIAVFALLTLVAGTAHAIQPPGRVVQAFACNLSPGQTMDDVWALMDALTANSKTMDSPDPANGMFVWMPYRGATPYDFVVGVISSDLEAMAAGSMAYQKSAGAAAIRARFERFAGCDSGIMMSEQLSEATIGMSGGDRVPDAVVETFRCTINDGSDMGDVDKVVKYWQDQTQATANNYLAYMWTPLRGGTDADFFWVGNSPDLATWAKTTADYENSDVGQKINKRFQKVSTCTSQMWMGYWLVTPKDF
jgi:hypothetical protein